MFKIKLKTSRVTMTESNVPGDVIECSNDEAWQLINEGNGELISKKQPEKPAHIIEKEEAALKLAEKSASKTTAEDNNLQEKEHQLLALSDELAEKEAQLANWESELNDRESALNDRELALATEEPKAE